MAIPSLLQMNENFSPLRFKNFLKSSNMYISCLKSRAFLFPLFRAVLSFQFSLLIFPPLSKGSIALSFLFHTNLPLLSICFSLSTHCHHLCLKPTTWTPNHYISLYWSFVFWALPLRTKGTVYLWSEILNYTCYYQGQV